MSSAPAPLSPIPESPDSPTTPEGDSALAPLKFASHMKQYPLAVSLKTEVMKLPLMGSIFSTADTVTSFMRSTVGIAFFCESSDAIADSILSQIDKLVPQLKTVQLQDDTQPTEGQPQVQGSPLMQLASARTNEHLIKPTVKLSNDIKVIAQTMIYNSEGKNRVLTPTDPVVKHINTGIESLGQKVLPGLKPVPKENQSSEFSRTIQMLKTMVFNEREPVTTEVSQPQH